MQSSNDETSLFWLKKFEEEGLPLIKIGTDEPTWKCVYERSSLAKKCADSYLSVFKTGEPNEDPCEKGISFATFDFSRVKDVDVLMLNEEGDEKRLLILLTEAWKETQRNSARKRLNILKKRVENSLGNIEVLKTQIENIHSMFGEFEENGEGKGADGEIYISESRDSAVVSLQIFDRDWGSVELEHSFKLSMEELWTLVYRLEFFGIDIVLM
nr:hypothetical protein pmam_390 [Pithovirus mammoth]